MFINFTFLMMEILPLAHREGKGCIILIQELAFLLKTQECVCKEGLERIAIVT
jgi:hypothetical protein